MTAMIGFYLAFRTLATHTTNMEFLLRWQIKKHVGLDTANKTISALFGGGSGKRFNWLLTNRGLVGMGSMGSAKPINLERRVLEAIIF